MRESVLSPETDITEALTPTEKGEVMAFIFVGGQMGLAHKLRFR